MFIEVDRIIERVATGEKAIINLDNVTVILETEHNEKPAVKIYFAGDDKPLVSRTSYETLLGHLVYRQK